MHEIAIQVGKKFLAFDSGILPPIGTRVVIDRSLSDDGDTTVVEVTGHEWRINPPEFDPATGEDAKQLPPLVIEIRTSPAS